MFREAIRCDTCGRLILNLAVLVKLQIVKVKLQNTCNMKVKLQNTCCDIIIFFYLSKDHTPLYHWFFKRMFSATIHFFSYAPSVRPQPSSCLYFQDFQGSKLVMGYLVVWPHFKCNPVIFQHLSLTYCIPLVKDQRSFYEIRSLANCINIKAINWFNRKQLNLLKTFLEYLGFYIVAYRRRFSPKSCLTNYVLRATQCVVLVSSLLTLNIFHALFYCFYC